MEVNVSMSDSKSGFQSYLSQYGCNYPAVLGSDGGRRISDAVGNGGGGNGKYLIYPDKSYRRYSGLPSTVQPHVCNPNPTITVNSPNGGETLENGKDYEITWESRKISGNVKIELLKNGSVQSVISSSESDDGSYIWTLNTGTQTGNSFEIKITSLSDPSVSDESDDYFSIIEEIIIDGNYTENFDSLNSGSELLPIGYTQSSSDDFDWLVLSGPTPSKVGASPNVTGPNSDNSSGGAGGNYLYVEASDPNNPGKAAIFTTPKININDLENPELSFFYHMFSDSGHMGSLEVDISEDGSWSNGEVTLNESDYGDEWHKETIDLSTFRSRSEWIQIRFKAETGLSWASDICIDDIEVKGNPVAIAKSLSGKGELSLNFHNSQLWYYLPNDVESNKMILSIYNMQGKEVYKNKLNNLGDRVGSINIMGTDIANGFYTARLQIDCYTISTNFIINK